MVPFGPELLTNAHATTKMNLEIRNFWKAEVECIFYEFPLIYLPKDTDT